MSVETKVFGKKTIWAGLIGIGLLVATLGLAGPMGHGREPFDPEGMMGRMLDRMTERLDLSAGQREAIDELFAAHRDEVEVEHERMKAAHEALGAQIHAESFDEAAIREASAVVAAGQADLAVARAKLLQQVRGVLTEEQQAEAEAMMQDHRARREDRLGGKPGHRPGHGHRRPGGF